MQGVAARARPIGAVIFQISAHERKSTVPRWGRFRKRKNDIDRPAWGRFRKRKKEIDRPAMGRLRRRKEAKRIEI